MAVGLPDACESFTPLNTEDVRKLIEGSTKKTCMAIIKERQLGSVI